MVHVVRCSFMLHILRPLLSHLFESCTLTRPVLPSEGLPGADDLLGSHPSLRGRPVLLLLVLRLDGVDPTLWRNVYFYLKEAIKINKNKIVVKKISLLDVYLLSPIGELRHGLLNKAPTDLFACFYVKVSPDPKDFKENLRK